MVYNAGVRRSHPNGVGGTLGRTVFFNTVLEMSAMRERTHFLLGAAVLLATALPSWAQDNARLRPHLADYDSELRRPDGHVDTAAMVGRLKELGVTTYYWLVWHAGTDWDDLKQFLPEAARAGIDVWVYLVPPSESPPHETKYGEPFRLDYARWGEEIARLSLKHPNLTAWVIDDFYANRAVLTPSYLRQIQAKAKAVNPRLAFLPLMYFNEIRPRFVDDYRGVIDGVVVAYLQDRQEIERAWAILNDGTIPPCSELSYPPGTRSHPGDYVTASQSAKVRSADRYVLQFSENDNFTGPTAGYHYKQVLVDGAVVWEEDVAGGTSGWHKVTIDVSQQLRGKSTCTLALRLVEKKGVSNFPLRWDVKELRGDDLQLDADLTQPQKWHVDRRGAFETEFGVRPKAGQRRFHIRFISMTAVDPQEFKMRHGDPASPQRIAQQLRLSLQAWREGRCDGVVTYCLDKRRQSPAFPEVRKAFHEFGGEAEGR
jgi:hypothetical protein